MKRLRQVSAFLGLSAIFLGGCTLPADDAIARDEAPLAADCTALGASIISHVCFHANYGPFQSVTGSSSTSFSGSSPNVNATHTHHTVSLPGSLGSHQGTVKFTPGSSGDWAIFLEPDVSLQVLDASGTALSVLLTHTIPSGDCSELSRVAVVNMSASNTYRLVLGPSSSVSSVGVVLERVDDFNAFYFEDADGDGYGDTDELLLTACEPPADYVSDDTDCDDSDDEVYPGAAEVCDGLDNDCNGSVDDGIGTCSAGARSAHDAAAAAVAHSDASGDQQLSCFCDCEGDPDSCSVYYRDRDPAIHPEAEEICDGVDNDCDGTLDILPDPLDEVIEHSCDHAELGPFVQVSASAVGAASSPNVNAAHTGYVISLPSASGGFAGQVRYRPVESTDYALMIDPGVSVSVFDASGVEVEIELQRDATACPALTRLDLVELEELVNYRLVFESASAAEVLLVVEEAAHEHGDDEDEDSGALEFFADEDGDGFGSPDEVVDACFAPPGHVADDGDCDDADASVHPGASELCDGIDNDCDGVIDAFCESSR